MESDVPFTNIRVETVAATAAWAARYLPTPGESWQAVENAVFDPEVTMQVTLEVPELVAQTLGYAREMLPRRALEALLVDECARGRLSRGKVAGILGLSFHEAEDLFRSRGVPYPAKSRADDERSVGELISAR